MRRTFLFAAAVVVGNIGCTFPQPSPADSQLQQELDANRAKWTAASLSNYEYTFSNSCFCPPEITDPVLITVESHEVAALLRVSDNTPIEPAEGGFYPTIPELFDVLQSALDGDAAAIVVEYDAILGYPTQIYVDWSAEVADEETSLSAQDLTAS